MKIIDFGVQEPYKTFLINGIKTIEGRLNKGKFKNLEVGSFLELNTGERFKIVGKNNYISFKEMLRKEGIGKVIPNKKTIEEGVDIYYNFYTKEQEKEFGVLAFKLEII